MIEKIVRVKATGRFSDYSAPANVSFGRVTLVYAENALGKTTLSAMLRSLGTGDPTWIEERQTLGESDQPRVVIGTSHGNASFRDGSWNITYPQLAVFDPRFATQNVYAGDAVAHEQKRNLHRFAIGEEGVKLATRIDQLDAARRRLSGRITALRGHIEARVAELDVSVDEFLGLRCEEQLTERIAQVERQITELRAADAIGREPSLSQVSLPDVASEEIDNLLGAELGEFSAEAERMVADHIQEALDEHGEAWLEQGVGYLGEEACPFCGQDVSAVELVSAYQLYFSTAYTEFKQRIDRMAEQVSELMAEEQLRALLDDIRENQSRVDFWDEYIDAELAALPTEEVADTWDRLKAQLSAHLARKAASPLEALPPDGDLASARQAYAELGTGVQRYNERIDQINELIEAKKREMEEADPASANRELARLKCIEKRHTEPLSETCEQYSARERAKDKLLETKGRKREALQEYTTEVLSQYQENINAYLKRFGADFRITESQESFIGGTPSISYRLEINDEPVPLGEDEDGEPGPCFRNTLSSGDRSTLAFAFFLARLDLQPDLEETVVVLDDPIASLDCFRKTATCQTIKRLATSSEQLIVLSHDPFFLRDIWDSSPRDSVCALQVARGRVGSKIAPWDICHETRTPFERSYIVLSDYLGGDYDGDLSDVASRIRPVLEAHLRHKAPSAFSTDDSLGDMIGKIRQASSDSPGHYLKPLVDELGELNEYALLFHHNQNPQAHTRPVQDGELRPYVERTLEVVHGSTD